MSEPGISEIGFPAAVGPEPAKAQGAARPESAPIVEPPPPDAPVKALVVDDDATVRRLVCHLLRGGQYEALEAADGAQALEVISQELPEIVLTDWEMPHIDGPALCDKIRAMALPYYIHVLLLTARNTPENVIHGLQSGADDYLTKPVQKAELLARLNTARRIVVANRRTARLARTDALTGLLTQRSFFEHLRQHFSLARRGGQPLACAMVDLDYFKRINDVHGHLTGDEALRTAADVLRRESRESDVVSRHGGEEFCILLPNTDEDGAQVWAERVRQAIAAAAIRADSGEKLTFTCSIGVAGLSEDVLSPEQLIDRADQALLCAKRSGRNRVLGYLAATGNEGDPQYKSGREDIFAGVLARDVMTPVISPLRMETPTRSAACFFLRSRITSAPVVDDQGKLVGVLSEKDLMAAIASVDGWQRPISQLMQRQVITYDESVPLRAIYEFLCRVSIRRVIIVRQGEPVGAISRGTLLRWFHCRLNASGELPHDSAEEPSPYAQDGREQLANIARRVAQEAEEFRRNLAADDVDQQALIIATATQLQGLTTELLSQSGSEGLARGAFSLGANPE